jgi:hypothetical protein
MIEQVDVLRTKLEVNEVAVFASEGAKELWRVAPELEQVPDERFAGRARRTCGRLNHNELFVCLA